MAEKIDDTTMQGICREFLRSALGSPDGEVSTARSRNLIAYNALPAGEFAPPEIPDRSDFVATDVADTIEGMLPELMKIFVSGDNAVEFAAKKPGGDDLAKTITAYINHVFYARNDGLNVLYDWFKDALLQKVGFVQVWAEIEKEDSSETFTGLTHDQLTMLLQDGGEVDGEPMQDDHGGITVTIKKGGEYTCLKVAAVAPHEMRVDSNARWGDDPAAIGRVYQRKKFQLAEEGYDVENVGLSTYMTSIEQIEQLGETSDWGNRHIHESHKLVDCAQLYFQIDRDGDGVAEWVRVMLLGDMIATKKGKPDIEKVDGHPFCEICPIPRPHAYFGDCPADFAYQQQKMRTDLIRSLMDSVYLSVNQRTYVNTDADVNIDDLLESRPGGIVRGRGPRQNAMEQIEVPNLGAPAWQMNDWVERWGESRTGFNRYSKGTDAEALNKTATGVQILTQKADMRVELIARFFAQGVRKMFQKLLKLATQHQDQQEWLEVNGEPVQVNPSEWKDQYNVEINVGIGHGTKDQQAQRYMAMLPLLNIGLQTGVVEPKNVASVIRGFAIAQEFKDPDEFAVAEPQGPGPQQAKQQIEQLQQHMQEMQAQGQAMHQELLKAQGVASGNDPAVIKANTDKARLDLDWYQAHTARLLALQKDMHAEQARTDAADALDREIQQGKDGEPQGNAPDPLAQPDIGPKFHPQTGEPLPPPPVDQIKQALADHMAVMSQHAANTHQVLQQLAQPKKTKVIRDAQNNIIGAEQY